MSDHAGAITPDPEESVTEDQLERNQAALDFFGANAERIKYFKHRAGELGLSGTDFVITLLNVDDPYGGRLADIMLPNHDWQAHRDQGEIPVARGLAGKAGIVAFLHEAGFTVAAAELTEARNLVTVVLDAEVALVLDVEFEEHA